ncbi:hypothetical protein QQG55_23275 [Brugia pahangi]
MPHIHDDSDTQNDWIFGNFENVRTILSSQITLTLSYPSKISRDRAIKSKSRENMVVRVKNESAITVLVGSSKNELW